MKTNIKNIDILCVGEVLIDFIGHQSNVQINQTKDYHRYLGGSPTNVAAYCSRLGLNTALVASVGKDGLGEFVMENLQKNNIDTQFVHQLKNKSTSVIFVSRTEGTPDFIPYREADYCIYESQITKETLLNTKIYHTTCFALSKDIAQTTILTKAKKAYELGCQLSIDINYSEKIWDSEREVLEVVKEYCQYNPLVKVSEDDVFRLFNKTLSHQEIFDFFHQMGVETICLTLGSNGVILSQQGKETIQLPAVKIEKVEDATGAGDAFWSGFLTSYIQQQPLQACLKTGLKVAAIKLQNIGGLPENIQL
ncbi:carbohydrate kinase family protein [Wenyingzhuangia marina]|uniref:Fructokinase n=1 Tax=Wenyingzhuangia marina TaxID=1195760 RepID=A0A1M5TY83_9FLAO|nr:carbohydrate kinase family protein [Wenyingzhuangia marina]GGF70450.1 putative sugar kinase YdjE [Wenyingzhuangia marina]SHH55699.1 fructokinase [Wenyingzhuangia marina]